MCNLIGIDHRRAASCKHVGDQSFPTAYSAGKADRKSLPRICIVHRV